MRRTVKILDIPVDNLTMEGAVERFKYLLGEPGIHTIYTPNAEIMMAAQREPDLKAILSEADMLLPDGAGVVLASKIIRDNLKERVAGYDLTLNCFKLSSKMNISYFFFGGKPGVAEEAAKKVQTENPDINIVGIRNGYFSADEESNIIEQINASNPDVLLVALGAPRQEKWIYKNKHRLNAKICIGVGGTFDVLAGRAKRAPVFFQKNGLEWLYRLYKEPWRFIRMLDLPRFILLVTAKKVGLKK
ncbi:WecB/TagA/CpsF family glycosyltransferase [Acetivibrio cellulolyticus]|uniref:WecB/TagA/CpsF family glycosyltransferase n=1 Tax=Acetivibrio cellulolyticus TaxID=35830 RepID=UPI0001E2E7C2|nr:WecB/TagA/CpsF family glycosyltransferase [Acetivibrio cellulolyticus]